MNNFLCSKCKAAMCPGCLEIADEYAELLLSKNRELSGLVAEIIDLKSRLDIAKGQAANWESVAKLGYPEVIQKWMDSEVRDEAT